MCTDVKLISNTTVERSRDKLLRFIFKYPWILPFFVFTHKVQEDHNIPQRNVSDSLLIGTPVRKYPNILGNITKISFFSFFSPNSCIQPKRDIHIFQKYEIRGPFRVRAKGRGGLYWEKKNKDIKSQRTQPMSGVTREWMVQSASWNPWGSHGC